jgi:pimeloyl-ACP methyl ester carboxylesterase
MPLTDVLPDDFLSTAKAARSVEIEGSFLKVYEFGSGEPVVLGGSYLWDVRMWGPQIKALSQRHRLIVPELWGHGASGALPHGTASLRDLARQHLAMLDQLGVERFIMVGLSAGGMWGAELALMAPERVSRLALIATSLAAEPDAYRERYLSLIDAVAEHRALSAPLRELIVPLFFSPTIGSRYPELPKAFDAALSAWNPERLLDSVVPLGRIIFLRRDALEDMNGLKMPMLVMTGSHDQAQPPERGRAMAERLHCRFLEAPEAGHIVSLEAPDFTTAALEQFLAAREA